MQEIYHKKNELQEVELFQDKECTIPFDFMNAKNLYIELKNGDCTPLNYLPSDTMVFTPYITHTTYYKISYYLYENRNICIQTLDDITPNLSKYIPEDNAVLFLSRKDKKAYVQFFINHNNLLEDIETYKIALQIHNIDTPKSITIFLPHGTQSELQKANKVEKELMEKYGVKEVNLFVLHWFYKNEDYDVISFLLYNKILNKIITTNSTGILPVQNSERLQVIDCNEIFEEYLKTER